MSRDIKVLSVLWDNELVGRISVLPDNLCVFEYDNQFIKNGTSISPFYLPLKPGLFTAKKEPFNGLFGVFSDSLPDGWGTLLTNRMLTEKGYDLSEITILDRLCLVGNNGIGVLSYIPEWKIDNNIKLTDLDFIAEKVEQILKYNNFENLEELYGMAGSSGGARPKVFTKFNNKDWIIKFRASVDPDNIGEMEYDYSVAAKKCGIDMSETKLFNNKYFGTLRFDIFNTQKYHVHSAAGLLYASHRLPSLDYLDLIKAVFVLTNDMNEAYKMFKRMIFNVVTKNKDDHAKNFSFIFKNDKWQLSPAYDLVKSVGFNNQHTTTILGKGNPSKEDVFKLAGKVNLDHKKAKNIYDEIFKETLELREKYKI